MTERKIDVSKARIDRSGYKWNQLWNWNRELGFFRSKKSSYTPVCRGSYLGLRRKKYD